MNAQESDGRYVEVTGSSEIEVVPDEIHFLVQIKEYWQEEYTGKSKKEEDFHTKVIGTLSRSDLVPEAEVLGKTLLECYPDSEMAGEYRILAEEILAACREADSC